MLTFLERAVLLSSNYILVMQCFRVEIRGMCHLSLVFSSYTHGSCVYRK